MASIRPSGGQPLRKRSTKSSSVLVSAHAWISTPSLSLPTSPVMPQACARRHTVGLKPTPCTSPRTRIASPARSITGGSSRTGGGHRLMAVPVTCCGYGYSGGYPSGSPQLQRPARTITSTSARASSCSPVFLRHAPGVGHGGLRLHVSDHCFNGFHGFLHCRRDGFAQSHAALLPVLRAETFRLATD